MLKLFLQIWYMLPWQWRRILTALPATVGAIVSFVAWDWIPITAGVVMTIVLLALPGPSDSEKKGYNF